MTSAGPSILRGQNADTGHFDLPKNQIGARAAKYIRLRLHFGPVESIRSGQTGRTYCCHSAWREVSLTSIIATQLSRLSSNHCATAAPTALVRRIMIGPESLCLNS